MFVIFEFLGYLIIEILFAIPGAILRWMHLKITGKKTSVREYSTRKAGWYYITGLLLVMGISLFVQISN